MMVGMDKPGTRSKYDETTCIKAQRYVDGFEKEGDVVPQLAGLAIVLGIDKDTVTEWAKDPEKEQFARIVKECKLKQERTLINGGLNGKFKEKTTGMLLSKHGYYEKQEIETTNKSRYEDMSDEQLEAERIRLTKEADDRDG